MTTYHHAPSAVRYLLLLTLMLALAGCYRKWADDVTPPDTSVSDVTYYRKLGEDYDVYTFYGDEPQYLDGGNAGFYENIYEHIEYPEQAQANKTQGKVTIYYLLKPDGTVPSVFIREDIGDGCGQAAVAAIQKALGGMPFASTNRIIDLYGGLNIYFQIP